MHRLHGFASALTSVALVARYGSEPRRGIVRHRATQKRAVGRQKHLLRRILSLNPISQNETT